MAFGDFSTDSIKTYKPLTGSNGLKPFSFEKKMNSSNIFSFGNITNTQNTEISTHNTISIEQKEAARANFINEFNHNFHELNSENQAIATTFITKSQITGKVDTDSREFKNLPKEVQSFIHSSLYAITGVKTDTIPNGKTVKLEPIEELKSENSANC